MSDLLNDRNELHDYVAQAHEARSEALARAGYVAVTGVGAIARSVGHALLRTARAIADWRQRRADVRALERLDDRMLRDIGISRADIWAAAHGTLGEDGPESAPVLAPAIDIALTAHAIAGCNDNGRRRAA